MLASVAEDLFRAVLQGAPPGTVYALVALGFVLAYKTSGIFNLAFGAQAYVSAVVYFKTHTEWGWPIIPAFIVSVVILAPLLGVVLEWLVFRHLRTRRAGRGPRRRHRVDDRPAGDRRRRDELRAEDRAADRGDRAPRQQRLLRRVRRLLVQPQRAGRDGRRAAGHRRAGPAVQVHDGRPAHAGGRREPADDRAERHRRRSSLGRGVGALVVLRRPGRRADRPALQARSPPASSSTSSSSPSPRPPSATSSACRVRSSAGSGSASSSPSSTRSSPSGATTSPGSHRSRTTSRRRSRSSCCSASSCSRRRSARRSERAIRSPASTRRPPRRPRGRGPPACRHHAACSAPRSSSPAASSCSPAATPSGSSSSPRRSSWRSCSCRSP